MLLRRLLYYWTIINKPDDELVKQVLKTQQLSPVRNDWCNTILNDLNFLEINLEEKEIAQMKKNKFKALVIEKIRHASNSFLYDQVQKHSKSTQLKASSGIQKYLTSQILTIKEKQVLFSLRTRTFNCKANYANQFFSQQCDFCNEIDKQEHLLHCNITKDIDTSKVKYSDIFGSLPQQIEIAKTMKRISDIREHSRKSSSLKEARCI